MISTILVLVGVVLILLGKFLFSRYAKKFPKPEYNRLKYYAQYFGISLIVFGVIVIIIQIISAFKK